MESQTARSPYPAEQRSITASEKIASLFQPDVLLSTQYFNDQRSRSLLEPEKRLMLAVLEDAILCFQDNHRARCGKNKLLLDEAQEWIFGVSNWIFGFENICSALGFDPEYIRAGLMRWREKRLPKRRSAPLWEGTKMSFGRKEAVGSGGVSKGNGKERIG